jgi:hypothetical protein
MFALFFIIALSQAFATSDQEVFLFEKEIEAHLNEALGDVWRQISASHASRQSTKRTNDCHPEQDQCFEDYQLEKRSVHSEDVAPRLIVATQNQTVSAIPSIILLNFS